MASRLLTALRGAERSVARLIVRGTTQQGLQMPGKSRSVPQPRRDIQPLPLTIDLQHKGRETTQAAGRHLVMAAANMSIELAGLALVFGGKGRGVQPQLGGQCLQLGVVTH